MSKQYNRSEIVKKIECAILDQQLATLYKEPCIKRTGRTKDTGELYSEVASAKLLDTNNIEVLFKTQIKKIDRKSYRINHADKTRTISNRDEEILAKELKGKKFAYLGTIKEYQVPLKSKRSDKGVGKIDLLSLDNLRNRVFLVELKAKDNKEGLLRAILEIITYNYQLNENQFLKDFNITKNTIIKSVLLEKGSIGYKEAREPEKHKNLLRLIKIFNIEIFLLENRANSIIERIKI